MESVTYYITRSKVNLPDKDIQKEGRSEERRVGKECRTWW